LRERLQTAEPVWKHFFDNVDTLRCQQASGFSLVHQPMPHKRSYVVAMAFVTPSNEAQRAHAPASLIAFIIASNPRMLNTRLKL
jgi:hypothetical protein